MPWRRLALAAAIDVDQSPLERLGIIVDALARLDLPLRLLVVTGTIVVRRRLSFVAVMLTVYRIRLTARNSKWPEAF
jgi:hypothetical protein